MAKAPQGGTQIISETKSATKKPRMYKVLLHNDDYTTMEFVVWLLIEVFHHDQAAAFDIMMRVHKNGAGVAGVFTREVAETKVSRTLQVAREHEFPLECSMEPE